MSLEIYCVNPACKRRHLLPESSAGRSVRCHACGETFIAGKTVAADASTAKRNRPETEIEPAWDAVPSQATTVRSTSMLPPTSGSIVGRFVIRSPIGAGAFGTVYLAYDPQLDRVVALKVPKPGMMTDEKRIERFLREAKAAAGLRHPHIVPVFDAGKDGENYYIASAFIAGKPLSDLIPEGGMEFERATRLVRQLAEALAYAHEQGIVHRDVKPQNVMIDNQDRVHLMDFGLASRQDEAARLTNDGAVMGTPAYMSPEQARGQTGEAQPATDQYAVGVVLYELLTGQTPFAGPPAVVIANVLRTEPDPPRKFRPDVPPDLETICLKAMSKLPEDRYADCQELADDLRRWLEDEPIAARRHGFAERAVRWVKKEPKLSAAFAAIALLLVVSVAGVLGVARRAASDASDAREAETRAESALSDARAARKREESAAAAFQAQFAEERDKLKSLQTKFDEKHDKVKALELELAEEREKVKELQALLPKAGLKPTLARLQGKWRSKDVKDGVMMVLDFAPAGKLTASVTLDGEPVIFDGSYKLDGEKVSYTLAPGGETLEIAISRLTDDDLEGKDKEGMPVAFKRVKPKEALPVAPPPADK